MYGPTGRAFDYIDVPSPLIRLPLLFSILKPLAKKKNPSQPRGFKHDNGRKSQNPTGAPPRQPNTTILARPALGHRRPPQHALPPNHTDYLILGSGISGASSAHHLQNRLPTSSILMLEARQTCSGATGRNGGHTKAASYRSFLDHEAEHGTAEAVRIARMEYAVIRETHRLAREWGVECDSHPCDTVDVVFAEAALRRGKLAIARMREVMGDEDPVARYEVFSAREARERFLTPGALGAFRYRAGSISAYRFTVGMLKGCLARGLNLQTDTPALSISRAVGSTGGESRWVVKTPRGEVEAKEVIVATNGYTAHLLPQMQGIIVPLRGQITAQRPGLGLPELKETVSFIYEDGYEYMITRPSFASDAGTIIIGGGLGTLAGDGVEEFGNTSDESLNSELSRYLTDCTQRYCGQNWGEDHQEGRVGKEWSGIMGTSADGLPYVGRVEGMNGVWICASFNGHGMVMCLKCAEAVMDMIVDGKAKEWFPKALQMNEERLKGHFRGRLNMKVQPPGEEMFQHSDA